MCPYTIRQLNCSIHGKHLDGRTYRLLVDSGAIINLIKSSEVPTERKPFQLKKRFAMGKDINYSYHAVKIPYLGKLHLFHNNRQRFPFTRGMYHRNAIPECI